MKLQHYLAVLISNVLILFIIGYLPAYMLLFRDGNPGPIKGFIDVTMYLIIYIPVLIISMNRIYKSLSSKIKEKKLGKIILKISLIFQVIGMFYFLSVVEFSYTLRQKIQFASISIASIMTEETITFEDDLPFYEYKLKVENLSNKSIDIEYRIVPVVLDRNKDLISELLVRRYDQRYIPISLPPGESYLTGRLPLYTTNENYCPTNQKHIFAQINAEIKLRLTLQGDSFGTTTLLDTTSQDWRSSFSKVIDMCSQ